MRIFALVLSGVAILAMSSVEMCARSANRHVESAEDWAWSQIAANKVADLSKRCGKELDPLQAEGWNDPCRRISPEFLVRILTNPKYRNRLPRSRVRLRGARIAGTINLFDTEIAPEVWIDKSRIDGDVLLADSHWRHLLSLEGTYVSGDLRAERMRADSDVLLDDGSYFRNRVELDGAKIGGNLRLDHSYFLQGVSAIYLRVGASILMGKDASFDQGVNFHDAIVTNDIDVSGSVLKEGFDGSGLNVNGRVFMTDGTKLWGKVNLIGAKLGHLDMSGSRFYDPVAADSLTVERDLRVTHGARFEKAVGIDGTKIGGSLVAESSTFLGDIRANSVNITGDIIMAQTNANNFELFEGKIGGSIFIGQSTLRQFGGDTLNIKGNLSFYQAMVAAGLNLQSAHVGQNLMIHHSVIGGPVSLDLTNVTDNLSLQRSVFANNVTLQSTKIGVNLDMSGARFYEKINGERANINGSVFAQKTQFWQELRFSGAKIGGFLKLDHISAARIDLSEGDAGQLLLADARWWCAGGKVPSAVVDGKTLAIVSSEALVWEEPHGARWALSGSTKAACGLGAPPALILNGVHVADFEGDENAWPPEMKLKGFHYDRPGSLGGDDGGDPTELTRTKWNNWLGRDRTLSSQPYTELSAVLGSAGRRELADAVQLAGREQDRRKLCHYWGWEHPLACPLWTLLFWFTGYGIESYADRIVIGVLGFTVFGMLVLCGSPNARRHNLLWRAGASLHQLLPVIELSKEFKDFFDNPPPRFGKEPNLARWQVGYFAVHAIAGWVLGFFLLAAMGGLIQK